MTIHKYLPIEQSYKKNNNQIKDKREKKKKWEIPIKAAGGVKGWGIGQKGRNERRNGMREEMRGCERERGERGDLDANACTRSKGGKMALYIVIRRESFLDH